jgi:hypothetical protein
MPQILTAEMDASDRLQMNRHRLYWNFRYRKDSYKARKAGIVPIMMTAKYGGDRLRIYGEPSEPTSKQLNIAKGIFRGWKAKERERRRLAK